MATVVLQYAGAAIGTLVGGPIGGLIGRAVGGIAGSLVDQRLFGGKGQRSEGPRLNDLRVMASEEGAAIPTLWGRMRVAGQVIWATNLEEISDTQTQSASSKGGPKSSSTSYSYFANFAVGLCEGEIDGIGRVWADGKLIDIEAFTTRLYTGSETQLPDSLIETIEGASAAPAYRGLAYIVFERLPLDGFGNRLPQLSFEVMRRGNGTADTLRAVNIIPGSTEFGYDTRIITRSNGAGITESENANVSAERTDWSLSIDQLQGSCRNLEAASLVVAWFGDDLRCASCTLKPRVDNSLKQTSGDSWSVAGVGRSAAVEVSRVSGAAAYGGTPSDATVIRAIQDLHTRGLEVLYYPFVLMDISQANALPDPYGGTSQAAYPWRGRITSSIAPGFVGTPDKTGVAATQIASFIGTALPSHFTISGGAVSYSGPAEWSYRRMILHNAYLCAAAGGVEAFLVGSELRGLTTLRSAAAVYPFVQALQTLAAEVKAILPAAKISYAADWTEYFGHQPGDASNDVYFHLDPLWASASIDFIGIDNYMPLSDWRDGQNHLDALAGFTSIYDLDCLKQQIASGEGFDWYYQSPAHRDAQTRTPITDGAYGKPWMFRTKDLKSWWSNQHFNRPAGVQSASATAWVPQSKPFWFTESGCPAIDKGSNGPHVFYDAKSSESALPPYSGGQQDDLMQNRFVRAVQDYWSVAGNHNPVSTVYASEMVSPSRIFFWAWDARPYPAFPVRTDIWADGVNVGRGHWLNGRLGAVDLGSLVDEIADRFGFSETQTSGVAGLVDGFVIDRPLSGREALEDLLQAFAVDAVESEGVLKFKSRKAFASLTYAASALVDAAADRPLISETRAQETDLPRAVRLGYVESGLDYRTAAVTQQRLGTPSAREVTLSLPAAVSQSLAQARADVALEEAWVQRTSATFALPPSALALEPGDVVKIDNKTYRLQTINDGVARAVEAASHDASVYDPPPAANRLSASAGQPVYGQPDALLMDLAFVATPTPSAPWIAAHATPWPGRLTLLRQSGATSYATNTVVEAQATMGTVITVIPAGLVGRLDFNTSFNVVMDHGALFSVSEEQLLGGANVAAIGDAASGFEIIQFLNAALIATNTYRVTGLLRAQAGSQLEMLPSRDPGARLVLLNAAVKQASVSLVESGLSATWRLGPQFYDHGHSSYRQITTAPTTKALRPLPPVQGRARKTAAGIELSWQRQTREGGDSWELAEVPLGEASESYRLELLNGSAVVRSLALTQANYLYSDAEMTADFGAPQMVIAMRVAQASAAIGFGPPLERTLNV